MFNTYFMRTIVAFVFGNLLLVLPPALPMNGMADERDCAVDDSDSEDNNIVDSGSDSDNENEYECSLCNQDKDETLVFIEPCKHRFHVNCIVRWRINNDSCPECQEPIRVQLDNAMVESSTFSRLMAAVRKRVPRLVGAILFYLMYHEACITYMSAPYHGQNLLCLPALLVETFVQSPTQFFRILGSYPSEQIMSEQMMVDIMNPNCQ